MKRELRLTGMNAHEKEKGKEKPLQHASRRKGKGEKTLQPHAHQKERKGKKAVVYVLEASYIGKGKRRGGRYLRSLKTSYRKPGKKKSSFGSNGKKESKKKKAAM